MKICYFREMPRLIRRSGVARAIRLQEQAARVCSISCTFETKDAYDILHINTIGVKAFFQMKKCKKSNVLVVMTAHITLEDHIDGFIFSRLNAGIFRKWITLLYSLADVLIAPSEHVKHVLQISPYSIKTPIEVISNGVDTSFFKKESKECNSKELLNRLLHSNAQTFHMNDVIVLSVGMTTLRKGFDIFIELALRNPTFKFIWVGKTNMLALPIRIKKYVRIAQKLENVFLPGYITNSDLVHFYNASSVYLMLSKGESEGLTILEALSCELPIIAVGIPIIYERLVDGKAVSLVARDDLDEIKKMVLSTIDHPDEEVKRRGRKTAEKYDIKSIATQLEKTYKKYLQAKNLRENKQNHNNR